MKNKNHLQVLPILPQNKRGDLPVTILVIGVILVSAMALFSFLTSSFSSGQSFTGISLMEELNAKIDAYYFYRNFGVDEDKINKALGIEDGKISLEAKPHTSTFGGKQKFSFSVEYRSL